MPAMPISQVVLYKHGVGYFEREARVSGETTLSLTFKQSEVSDVLKSLTVLDLDGGHIASVSYDSTKPLEQLLAEVDLTIPDENSLVGLLPQLKGALVAVQPPNGPRCEGILLGVDRSERKTAEGVVEIVLISLLTGGEVRSFDLHGLEGLEILDPALRRDLEFYLRTLLSAKKKDARVFTFFAQGDGERTIRLSYTLEAPVWKATYRILLGEENQPPRIQGWAVVDNTQDEDWTDVRLSLVAGLPVSFIHDLYTPRYIRRPVVAVRETTGVLPPEVEAGIELCVLDEEMDRGADASKSMAPAAAMLGGGNYGMARQAKLKSAASSMPAQVRERKLGDLFAYDIEHPVTIRRNQSALVPIVLRSFEGRPVLLHNKATRPGNPMRCVEFKNTTGLTLEGGPVTVLEGGSYVGEAMLDTLKPDEERLVPYAVELSVQVLDNIDSQQEVVKRVVIRERRLNTYRLRVRKTTYTFTNRSEVEHILYLDHLREDDWKLVDTSEPQAITENHWRFRIMLPAKKTASFAVRQQVTIHHFESFNDLTANQLAYWLEQKYLDKRAEKTLRQAIEVQQRLAALEQRLGALNQERDQIHIEQKRLRENLQALGERSSEKELRERFVKTLTSQEDRLEQIAVSGREGAAERNRLRDQLNAMLGELEYETMIG